MADFYIESTVSEPYVLPMEDRVARLEDDMRDVKSLLSRLEPMIIRIDATLTSTLPHLATKAEMAEMRVELHNEISGFRSEVQSDIAVLRSEVKDEIAGLRSEVKGDITGLRFDVTKDMSGLRLDVNKDIAGLRSEMNQKLADLPTKTYLWGILGVLITAYGAGLAALGILK